MSAAAHRHNTASLKYAVVERERRYRVSHLPDGAVQVRQIIDR